MEYSIKQLAQLAGVSARTLRYYDEIGLLKPLYVNEAGYRFYGEMQLNLLQQICFIGREGCRYSRLPLYYMMDSLIFWLRWRIIFWN